MAYASSRWGRRILYPAALSLWTLGWVPVIAYFQTQVASITKINGPSMHPFFNPNKDSSLVSDRVINLKFNVAQRLEKGMVVIFRSPTNPERIAVKRIVGVESDLVVTKKPYPFPYTVVPAGHVWVEGDNSNNTLDSNTYGPISIRLIEGTAEYIVWPPNRIGPVRWKDWKPEGRSLAFTSGFKRALFSRTHRNDQRRKIRLVPTPIPPHTHMFSTDPKPEPQLPMTVSSSTHNAKASRQKHSGQEEDESRPPYLHAMLAGGLGGSTGDMLMHSLDTVKTRQQGDPNFPSKYRTIGSSYYTIWKQEGIRRGLYGGWQAALLGSFPGTVLFFGSYEYSKRLLIDAGIQQHVSYLAAGFIGDFAASIVYVPSEVLKTRLQLQGRHNNPYFVSGYNYRGTTDAARTIVRQEGFSALFHGFRATLTRDLPFSALQFMFWEQFRAWAVQYKKSRDIGAPLEMMTGSFAGGLAGFLTTPLDVVKTRLQTQVSSPESISHSTATAAAGSVAGASSTQKRGIAMSSPSTHVPKPGALNLETSSVIRGLRAIYQVEGIAGWFRGVGPRTMWTFVQSGTMLFLYQRLLRQLEIHMPPVEEKQL
ncbi:hypothetical protein BROUX41_001526 [Berkeleyomyces rouxiae]